MGLVDARRSPPAPVPPVVRARPSTGMSAAALPPVLGEESGLAKPRATSGHQRFLEATDLPPQTVPLALQAVPLALQAICIAVEVVLLASQLLGFTPQALVLAAQAVNAVSTPRDLRVSRACRHHRCDARPSHPGYAEL